jgi:hypothetical protein
MDLAVVYEMVIAAVVLIVLGYFVSLILHKRTFDAVVTQLNVSTTSMVSLLSQYAYYGLYERSEILRTIANVVGVDLLRDTVAQVQYYPAPAAQVTTHVSPAAQ